MSTSQTSTQLISHNSSHPQLNSSLKELRRAWSPAGPRLLFARQARHSTAFLSHAIRIASIHLTPLMSHHSQLIPFMSHHSSHTTRLFTHHSSYSTHLTVLIPRNSALTSHLIPFISHHSSHSTHHTTTHLSPVIPQDSNIRYSSYTTHLIPSAYSGERHLTSHVVIRSFYFG